MIYYTLLDITNNWLSYKITNEEYNNFQDALGSAITQNMENDRNSECNMHGSFITIWLHVDYVLPYVVAIVNIDGIFYLEENIT